MQNNRDQMQERRIESKYVVSEAVAREISSLARIHLELDPHSLVQPDSHYPVHSLYLDSDQLASYWATLRRDEHRFKLRIRFYTDEDSGPAYIEIKQRDSGTTRKKRCPVNRKRLPALLTRKTCRNLWGDLEHAAVIRDFINKMKDMEAGPKLHIAYEREAYVSPEDNSVRLTLDRNIRSEPVNGFWLSTQMRQPRFLCEGAAVLEVKIAGPEPVWIRDMVKNFDLREESFAKYITAVAQHGLDVGAFAPGQLDAAKAAFRE